MDRGVGGSILKTLKMEMELSDVVLAHHERGSGFNTYCVRGHTS